MKRVATGVVLLALIAAAVVAVSVGAASTHAGRRAQRAGDDAHDLGRLERRPRAQGVQEGRGRVRPEAPGRRREGRRRDQRRQDLRRAPLRQRPGRRQLVHVVERRDLLPVRRLDRPRPAPQAGPHRRATSSRRRRATTRSTRAPAARCRCSPTRPASTTTRRSSRRPASPGPPKTLSRARGLREEADARRTRTARSRSSATTRT